MPKYIANIDELIDVVDQELREREHANWELANKVKAERKKILKMYKLLAALNDSSESRIISDKDFKALVELLDISVSVVDM